MPMLTPDQQKNVELGLGQRGSLPAPEPDQAPEPGLWGAAFRRGNLFGTLYERMQNAKPEAPAVPDYDPLTDIKGYEHVAPMFTGSQSPAETQWIKEQYDREQRDSEIIASHKGYGLAATMAAGLTDPITLASMAIPVGGEVRLATALRSAVVTGATGAAQIAAQRELEVSPRSFKSDALNVAGSAVLGGLLGSVLHTRVPAAKRVELAEGIDRELHANAPTETTMGPIDGKARIFDEPTLPKEMEDVPPMPMPGEHVEETVAGTAPPSEETTRFYHGGEPDPNDPNMTLWATTSLEDAKGWAARAGGEVEKAGEHLWYVDVPNDHPVLGLPEDRMPGMAPASRVELPPELAKNRQRFVEAHASGSEEAPLGALSEYENEAAAGERRASSPPPKLEPLPARNTKVPDAREDSILQYLAKHKRGLSSEEAEAQGIDKAAFMDATARVGIKRAFRKGGMTFDEAAETLADQGYPVKNAEGNYDANTLLDAIDEELRGKPQHSERNTRAALEAAHDRVYDQKMQSSLETQPELSAEYAKLAPDEREFTNLASEAREYDKDAAESLLESQRSDGDVAAGLRRIVSHGRAAAAAEYESSAGARLLEAAGQSEGAGSLPAGLPEPPTGIGEPLPDVPVNTSGSQSFGAAGANTPDLRGEGIAKGAVWLDKALGFVSPASRVGRSPSLAARQILQEMVNLPMRLAKNYAGIATAIPIERNLWNLQEAVHVKGIKARQALWNQYLDRVKAEGGDKMSYGEFGEQVSAAMRRNDTHAIPEVAKAAQQTRALVFEPLKQRAIKLGLLPADVKPEFADSYLMRQYNVAKIRDNQSEWIKLLSDHFRRQGVDGAESLDLAHQVTRNVNGSERGLMDWKMTDGIVPKSGRFKERTLSVPDEVLEPFLNNNIEQLSHSYLRSMGPEVEFTERFGSRDMKDQFAAIYDDYGRLISAAKDDKEKAGLVTRMQSDIRDMSAMRDRLFGIYGQPKDPSSAFVRTGRLLRTVNAGRLLGAATLAHFPDIANVMMRYGMGNTLAAMGKILTSPEAMNLTRNEAHRFGVGLDMVMSSLSSQLGDYGAHSSFAEQRIAQKLMGRYTTFTGEVPLISMVQQLTSTMAQHEIIKAGQHLAAGGELSGNRIADFAAAGLEKQDLVGIAAQHEKFGANVNGLYFGMSDKWEDQALSHRFESAVAREGHSVTLRPGAGDTPLFMSTEWGKTLRQFTTFGYAATRSVLNPIAQGLAHADPRAAQAIMALSGAGALSYYSKQIAAGQPFEPPTSGKFALEVLDKSNLMGWTGAYVFPALWSLGFDQLSRWSDQDPVETMLGPSAGTLASIYKERLFAKMRNSAENDVGLNDEDGQQPGFNRHDLHFLRRLMPGQNHFVFRNAINYTEDAIGDAFDLPGTSNKERRERAALEGSP